MLILLINCCSGQFEYLLGNNIDTCKTIEIETSSFNVYKEVWRDYIILLCKIIFIRRKKMPSFSKNLLVQS